VNRSHIGGTLDLAALAHLSESQRAIVAGKLANLPKGTNQYTAPANLPTQAKAAEMLNVSERSVRSARSVIDDGSPELVHAVEQGRVSVSAAADVARLEHRPADPKILAREARHLTALGLTHDDIAACLGLTRPAVRQLLNPSSIEETP
jgi:hypothetical protein